MAAERSATNSSGDDVSLARVNTLKAVFESPEFSRFRTWPISLTQQSEHKLQVMGLKLCAQDIDGTTAATTTPNDDTASVNDDDDDDDDDDENNNIIRETKHIIDSVEHNEETATVQQPQRVIAPTSFRTGKALSDALVTVGPGGHGGTGSFISADGLIITNHHVALDAVRRASTVEHDYVQHGFVATTRASELPTEDCEAVITRSCEDISQQFLNMNLDTPDNSDLRSIKFRQLKAQIEQEKRETFVDNANLSCEVVEMYVTTYQLFFVPPTW